MKELRYFMFALICVAVTIAVLGWVRSWQRDLNFYTEILETRTDFNGAEVDELWRFRNENQTSARFEELYQQKIKPLSGASWNSNEEVRWSK